MNYLIWYDGDDVAAKMKYRVMDEDTTRLATLFIDEGYHAKKVSQEEYDAE
ncbi:hypothetical protein JFL43_02850 [Viridibacillus sp. YIM B01967]|uniref:Phage protein n=1 Tax=Viridibacillus soli TaxID=2798301 RepID=A0ABS1H341_9BACL|nr:hypothetical protein [Viridibacillus soli]MBK3493813.1 hypothetical protein [Viridibacillus soli]